MTKKCPECKGELRACGLRHLEIPHSSRSTCDVLECRRCTAVFHKKWVDGYWAGWGDAEAGRWPGRSNQRAREG